MINGWTIYAHPLFLDQLEVLIAEVEALRAKDPKGYGSKNASRRLAAITRLMLQDPSRREYQQGSTLGAAHRHWRRAKFFQQYRLFFRFHIRSRVIVLGWVNDTDTRRAYGSKSDAYRVFQSMLASGHPPDDWDELLKEAVKDAGPLEQLTGGLPGAGG
ncbi:type II toxin-antitoxin system YhaV family toxin [Cyanobium sp. FGCU-52]|nr:type II toxin-antitoxin system YhaV family toxin [Cyanobium sp. FGCU52]